MTEANALEPYDAVLLASFGGPEKADEIMPFLRRVTAGRGIPDERLADVAHHYEIMGGRSPINDQNRALIAALRAEFERRGITTPIVWGNRNSEPFLADTLRQAYADGARRVVTLTTSAYSSYSSCRQYREDLAAASHELSEDGSVPEGALSIDKVRQFATHPSFARTNTRLVTDALREFAGVPDEQVQVVFVTHSIPLAMDDTSGPGDGDGNLYWQQHDELGAAILSEANATLSRELEGALVYCSRSGPPSQPWLEPDINDHLENLAERGVTHVVVAPIGFVSDHMEVAFDLDTEAAEAAEEAGLAFVRTPTPGVREAFVEGIVDLIEERLQGRPNAERPHVTDLPGAFDVCRPGCCENVRAGFKPAAAGIAP